MSLPATATAMVTMGYGDRDQMVLGKDWPRADPQADAVLIRVGACRLNKTEANRRAGWYSKIGTSHLAAATPDAHYHAVWACQDMPGDPVALHG